MSTDVRSDVQPLWAVVGNMTREPRAPDEDGELHTGTRMFAPGAKLYLGEIYWGEACASGHVIGQHRGSKRLVNCVINMRLVLDLRTKLVYSPGTIIALRKLDAALFPDREAAEELLRPVKSCLDGERERITGPRPVDRSA